MALLKLNKPDVERNIVGLSTAPLKYNKAPGRYVDTKHDYDLGDGTYAYIGVVIDTGKNTETAVARAMDVRWVSNGVLDYVADNSRFAVDYTTYKTAGPKTSEIKAENHVVVVYKKNLKVGSNPVSVTANGPVKTNTSIQVRAKPTRQFCETCI